MKINMPKNAAYIIDKLMEHGFEAYIVGGCVRDSLLGHKPKDWDITTSASPLEVKELFHNTIDTGIQHGTVTVMLDREPYEVTTYRVDGEYADHRRPTEVTFTKCLAEDLLRRDFTINAMAYNDAEGLIDLHHGAEDLEKGIIRCVGVAEQRFDEDALRILRALRFAARFDFEIEEETQKAMVVKKEFLKDISAERIREELTKMLISDHPEMLIRAYELGITALILPEWDLMMETKQNNPHHKYSVGMHTMESMKAIKPTTAMRYTMLLHDAGKPAMKTTDEKGIDHFKKHPLESKEIARKVLRRLKFDNDTIKTVTTLVEWHDWRAPSVDTVKKYTIRKMANRIGIDLLYQLFEVQAADVAGQSEYQKEDKLLIIAETKRQLDEIVEAGDCVNLKQMQLDGKDLIALGVKPGKEMGVILNALLKRVLKNPSLNTKEQLTELAKEMI